MSIKVIDDHGKKLPCAEYIANNQSTAEILKELKWYERILLIAAIASFIATALSVIKYLAGGELDYTLWTNEQAVNAGLGLALVAAIVACETFLFSSGYRGVTSMVFSIVFVGFGVFTEVTQAMERENEGVMLRSQQSPTYQAALESIKNLSANASAPVVNPYAHQIAEQAQIVARCEANVAVGTEKHCKGDTARLNALEVQAQAAMTATASASSNAVVAALTTAKSWERDESQHYGMIKLLKSWFDIDATQATFWFSTILILVFRCAFWWSGDQVAAHRQALKIQDHNKPRRKTQAGTQNTNPVPDTGTGVPTGQNSRTGTQNANTKTQATRHNTKYDKVPVMEIVRLATPQLLCMIADGDLKTFSVRAVDEALKSRGFGKSNVERKTEIYPLLQDEFEKEKYISKNPDWIEFKEGENNPNGNRQMWIIDKRLCSAKARGIPRS